jgi:hypothetical protein
MTEAEYSQSVQQVLSKYFNIKTEVWSICGKSRIDLVITDKINSNVVFGVEIKRFDRKRGNDIGKFIEQGVRYMNNYFNIDGVSQKIPILLCPALSYNYFIMAETKKIDKRKEKKKSRCE